MTLTTLGINHTTAALDTREQFVFDEAKAIYTLNKLKLALPNQEAVILSTCNRTEIYSYGENAEAINDWLTENSDLKKIQNHLYQHQDQSALKHMMRVAAGLDSMVVGEPQILGQMKRAFQLANDQGQIRKYFNTLFPAIFNVAKLIRSETDIGKQPVSLVYMGLQLAKKIFTQVNEKKILLIGAGETIALAATHLSQMAAHHLYFSNRSLDKAQKLADQFQGQAIDIAAMIDKLSDFDIIISATASPIPILGKGAIESAIKKRKHKPIMILDLAMPRDIETEVNQLEDIYYYDLDDLQHMIQNNCAHRLEAAKQAEAIIELQAEHYFQQLSVVDAADIIRDYRNHTHNLRDQALEKAKQALQQGENPEIVLTNFAQQITNKFLHHPTVKLRNAAYNGRQDILQFIKDWLKVN